MGLSAGYIHGDSLPRLLLCHPFAPLLLLTKPPLNGVTTGSRNPSLLPRQPAHHYASLFGDAVGSDSSLPIPLAYPPGSRSTIFLSRNQKNRRRPVCRWWW